MSEKNNTPDKANEAAAQDNGRRKFLKSGVAAAAADRELDRVAVRRQRALSRYLYEHFYCHPQLMRMGARARRILSATCRGPHRRPRDR